MSAAAWNTGRSVSKAEAKSKILEMAREQGITGPFKVFYENEIVADPDDLPDTVDMNKVRVSAVLDQA